MSARRPIPSLLAALVAGLLVMATAGYGSEQPPRDLHWVDDHWTAWSPPTPPPDAQVYVIQRGDTLWDLATRFYSDPYLWPQLWEQNQYILDAHWIYPGDPLVVADLAVPPGFTDTGAVVAPPLDAEQTGELDVTTSDDDAPDEDLIARSGRSVVSGSDGPVPLGHESDIYCSGFIGGLEEVFAYRITGSEFDYLTPTLDPSSPLQLGGRFGKAETEKVGLSIGDIAYIDGGRADGLAAGEQLTAVQPRQPVVHPLSGKSVGRYYQYAGRLRVLAAQETTAIAEVIMACDMVLVGSSLQLFEPEPIPLRRITPMRPVNYPAPLTEVEQGANIIYAKDTTITLGAGQLVFIDRGAEHEVAPGDLYTIYRRTPAGIPPIVLGEIGVLSVHRDTALARILSSRYTVHLGDSLLPK